MDSRNPMIVGRETLPVPGDPFRLLIGGEDRSRKISLSINGTRKDIRLNSRHRPLLMIGRSKLCDVVLPHKKVSTRHACLKLIGSQIYCVDLVSSNGTYWGNVQSRSGWLKVGHPITIRPFSIAALSIDDVALEDVELPEVDLLSKQDSHRLPCQSELTFLNGRSDNRGNERWQIVRPITLVGSSPRCKLQFDDSSVSRVHCSLIVTPTGLWVIDLLSGSGTYVNGERVTFRLLGESDEVRIGCFRFAVNYRWFSESHPQPLSTVESAGRRQGISGGGISEEFVLSLVDRFAAIQQQSNSMNHQQMMAMLQMMNTMHQNHHDLVRGELTRIQRLDDEIQQIQCNLSAGHASSSPISPSETQSAPPEIVTPLPPMRVSFEEETPASPTEMQALQHVETDPPPATESESESDLEPAIDDDCDSDQNDSVSTCEPVDDEFRRVGTAHHGSAVDSQSLVGDAHPMILADEPSHHDVADDSADQHVDDSEAKDNSETSDKTEDDAPVPPRDHPPRDQKKYRTVPQDENDHLRFIERLAKLERERNSRWKKIMRMLTGKGD